MPNTLEQSAAVDRCVSMTTTRTQECSTVGCSNAAAFTTRAGRPGAPPASTACLARAILSQPNRSTLPRVAADQCLTCDVQAYTVEKNTLGEKTCRACHWENWAATERVTPLVPSSSLVARGTCRGLCRWRTKPRRPTAAQGCQKTRTESSSVRSDSVAARRFLRNREP